MNHNPIEEFESLRPTRINNGTYLPGSKIEHTGKSTPKKRIRFMYKYDGRMFLLKNICVLFGMTLEDFEKNYETIPGIEREFYEYTKYKKTGGEVHYIFQLENGKNIYGFDEFAAYFKVERHKIKIMLSRNSLFLKQHKIKIFNKGAIFEVPKMWK